MVPVLFQASFCGILYFNWKLSWIPESGYLILGLGLFLIGFALTQGLILLASRRKWELTGWRKVILGCFFPGVIQTLTGRLVWGSALSFVLLITPFVASWFLVYYLGNIHDSLMGDAYDRYLSYNFYGKLWYGLGFFAVLSPLWLPLYLLNVWEVCCLPAGVRTRAGRAFLTFFLSLSFPGLGAAYVGQRRYWGYALFSFGAVFVLFLLGFAIPILLGSGGLASSCVMLAGYLSLPLVSLVDWYFSCLRNAAQDVKKP
jgi:hypothetical protein